MPSLSYNDLRIDVSLVGDFHIRLRTLDLHLNKTQVAELIYPLLDAKEKALCAPLPSPSPSS
jgi:hypothetical protein